MSFAAFRTTKQQEDLRKLAEQHYEHDLEEEDRQTLKSAATTAGTYATLGSLVGLGLGVFLAFRIRRSRVAMFEALRAAEKPTAVVFAGGRTEPVPDLTPYLAPTRWGDIFTYFFFGLGGLFLGGETGLLVGSWSGSRAIRRDPAKQKRIENAFRRFRADAYKKEAERLESGTGPIWE